MADFGDYLRARAVDGLRGLSDDDRADVYVVSFYVHDEHDEPRRPVLTVGTNTERQVELSTNPPVDFVKPNPWWTPTDEIEARWNYAFWLQNELTAVGDERTDRIGAELRDGWVRSLGLWYEESDFSDEALARGEAITKAFVELCVATVRDLHESQLLSELFGRAVPIIVHELEYYKAIAVQNAAANGSDLIQGLVSWIDAM